MGGMWDPAATGADGYGEPLGEIPWGGIPWGEIPGGGIPWGEIPWGGIPLASGDPVCGISLGVVGAPYGAPAGGLRALAVGGVEAYNLRKRGGPRGP